jgi:hypothetical protein
MASALSLQALLAKSIDYAGMFPPCSLDLARAVTNYASYARSTEAWMLAAFVLPAEKFEVTKPLLRQFDQSHPFRVSVLGPKTPDPPGFSQALRNVTAAMQSFARNEVVSVDQLEMFLPDHVDLNRLSEARSTLGDVPAFLETPVERAEQTIGLIAELNATSGQISGFKLRTGGVTADVFPTSAQIAKVLVLAGRARIPIKFTAGLHHPIRQHREEVNTRMHGFLNVVGAAVLCSVHNWDEQQTAAMLEDEDAQSFSFADEAMRWREWQAELDAIKEQRKRVFSFGSCSFDEPREDLRALRLM